MNHPMAIYSESPNKKTVITVIAVDVRYFGDGLFDFKWAFKKLRKSIPKALKKVTIINVISKE